MLTDAPSFQGGPEYLDRGARGDRACRCCARISCTSPIRWREARAWGADCILIIMAAVDDAAARELEDAALALGMDVLVEVHDEAELERALRLQVAADRHQQPRPARPSRPRSRSASGWRRGCRATASIVGESGIFTPADLARLAAVGISHLPGRREPDAAEPTSRRRRARCSQRERAPRAGASRPMAKHRTSSRHLGKGGEARMVDVSGKAATERVAVAEGRVVMAPATLDLVRDGNAKKGDVLGAARIAGIMAAKRTHELIPLCHPLPITKVDVDIEPDETLPGLVRARDRQGHRPDRRRDGGADRRVGRLPHHLRHGEGGRARHAHRGHPPGREERRQVRPLPRRRS